MSTNIGKQLVCDRCGATTFLPYIGTEEFDGGYTRVNDFQTPEEPWALYEDFSDTASGQGHVDLCPTCRELYIKVKNDFISRKRVDILDQT